MTRHRSHAPIPPAIRPIGIYPYFDNVQVWVRQPLDREALLQLESASGRGGIHPENGPAKFDARLRQRIELRQPSADALRQLARRDDVLINKVEITIDYTLNSRAEQYRAWEFLTRHIVRRWHGKNQKIRVVRGTEGDDEGGLGGTRYDAARRAPNKTVLYQDKFSRVTGELNCVHLEWRLNGLKAVRNAGIESGQDLLEFNHRTFWQKRLRLYDVDRRRLGRLIRNRAHGTRRRTSEDTVLANRFKVNLDGMTAEGHVGSYDTVQELVDHLTGSLHLNRVHRALVPISTESLLPE
jgi:hypothetical protein